MKTIRVGFYNLKQDITGKNDLAEKMPDQAAELHKMLKGCRKDVDAQIPTPNGDHRPKEQKQIKNPPNRAGFVEPG
jgi:hypothetical protein